MQVDDMQVIRIVSFYVKSRLDNRPIAYNKITAEIEYLVNPEAKSLTLNKMSFNKLIPESSMPIRFKIYSINKKSKRKRLLTENLTDISVREYLEKTYKGVRLLSYKTYLYPIW